MWSYPWVIPMRTHPCPFALSPLTTHPNHISLTLKFRCDVAVLLSCGPVLSRGRHPRRSAARCRGGKVRPMAGNIEIISKVLMVKTCMNNVKFKYMLVEFK